MKIPKVFMLMALVLTCIGQLTAVQHRAAHSGRIGHSGRTRPGMRRGFGARQRFLPGAYGSVAYMPDAYAGLPDYSGEDFMQPLPTRGLETEVSTRSEYGPGFAKIMTTNI